MEGGCAGTLWVIVNSDSQAARKKGKSFMPAAERVKMVRALRCVDAAMEAPDEDDSVVQAIEAIQPDIFAIGLDEGPEYMKAERAKCKELDIQIVCPLGRRVQSSTWLIEQAAERAKANK
jgi:glycerol-3-phosphate cytidylyltransferase-like family protein